MNAQQFLKIMPHADAGKWLQSLNAAMLEFSINTPVNQAAFIATLAVESDQLCTVEENLNYSATALARTWPNRYANDDGTPNRIALMIANSPQRIANNVYADRMGNGPESSGDGWAHRGAGPIQLTGKANQYAAALFFEIDPEHVREWLLTPEGGCRSAARFWHDSGCGKYAEIKDFDGVRDAVNIGHKTAKIGDAIGYAKGLQFFNVACQTLGA